MELKAVGKERNMASSWDEPYVGTIDHCINCVLPLWCEGTGTYLIKVPVIAR